MIYSVHAWHLEDNDECFRNFTANPSDPNLAIQSSIELLIDNPSFTLVMLRVWFQVVRFDHELGAIQFIRKPNQSGVTVRIDRLINLLAHGKENKVYASDVLIRDRKPIKVQMEFNSPEDVLAHQEKLLPYLLDDPPAILSLL